MLTGKDFLDKCILLDLETDGSKLYHIGAVYSGQAFERKGRFDLQTALKKLDSFASEAEFVLGHNLLGHDLPVLETLAPDTGLTGYDLLNDQFTTNAPTTLVTGVSTLTNTGTITPATGSELSVRRITNSFRS